MKPLLLLSIILLPAYLFCQKKIIYTDSSRIEIDTFRNQRIEEEFIKNKNLIRWTYYNEQNIVGTLGFYDTVRHYPIGVWQEFDDEGKLIRIENYDEGTWTVINKRLYPHKSYMDGIKEKADKIIIATYGMDFFKKHVKWSFGQSYIYFKGGGGDNWTEPTRVKPTHFLIRYDLVFGGGKVYDDMIEFHLDAAGRIHLPFGESTDTKGFEKIPPGSKFQLDEKLAIEKATAAGLIETDSTKAEAFLHWEFFKEKKEQQFAGQFRYYVLIKTNTIKDIKPAGRSTVINKYDVYVFNPWTGQFVEKKRMKTIRGWEEMSGSSTGLLPDE